MDDKISVSGFSPLSRTALMNLYIRGTDVHLASGLFRDERAREMLLRLDYDFTSFAVPGLVRRGTILRTECLDRLTDEFAARAPRAVVVNLGAGLDRRWDRIRHQPRRWYDLDVAEVIAVRRRFMRENGRYAMLEGSAFDVSWMEKIEWAADEPLLVLAEGLLMYFEKERVRELLIAVRRRFGPYTLLCDVPSRLFRKFSLRYPTLRALKSPLRWGVRRVEELEDWDREIKVENVYRYLASDNEYLSRYRYLRNISFLGNLSRIARLAVGGGR